MEAGTVQRVPSGRVMARAAGILGQKLFYRLRFGL
jgi:hypothetical protein